MTSNEKSLIEEYESFPRGAQELAAARLAQSAAGALRDSLRSSGKTAREVANLLGVTEGAVSQVLNSDGNVRIATLARYLRAMGYQPRVEVSPAANESVPPLPPRTRRQRRQPQQSATETVREKRVAVSVSRCNVTDGDVVAQALLLVLPHEAPGARQHVETEPSWNERRWHILDAGIAGSFTEGWRAVASSSRGAGPRRPAPKTTEEKDDAAGMCK